jgi:hypothetical protein
MKVEGSANHPWENGPNQFKKIIKNDFSVALNLFQVQTHHSKHNF